MHKPRLRFLGVLTTREAYYSIRARELQALSTIFFGGGGTLLTSARANPPFGRAFSGLAGRGLALSLRFFIAIQEIIANVT